LLGTITTQGIHTVGKLDYRFLELYLH